jgi:CO dehydrogenase/acetyl-CoA synthase gamma subunit (corrinoid Fe-S protein)
LTKEFDSKVKELEDRAKEFDKFREERTGELLRLQGAYKALKELLHAD